MTQQAYPLAWPKHWPRSEKHGSAQFKTTLYKAIENVHGELKRFGKDSGKAVSNVLISSNFSLTEQRPKDPGVACYFTWDGLDTCIAVDRYPLLEHNLQAIFHCLEAERTKLRHGGLNLVRAAFRGYAALPPPSHFSRKPWEEVLGLPATANREAVERRWKALRSKYHPDKPGGDAKAFAEVNRAWEAFNNGGRT